MSAQAPTQHDLFEHFKLSALSRMKTWRTFWEQMWAHEISFYFNLNWHLMAIAKHSKRPIEGRQWSEEKGLTEEEAMDFATNDFNLAVVAGFSNLVILDYDEEDIPEELLDSRFGLISKTPRGYDFFTRGPFEEELWTKLQKQYPGFESARVDILYSLLPLSNTCIRDFGKLRGKSHNCERHDYRVRTWIHKERQLSFKEFIELI